MIYCIADYGAQNRNPVTTHHPEGVIFLLNGLSSVETPARSLALKIRDQHRQPVLSMLSLWL